MTGPDPWDEARREQESADFFDGLADVLTAVALLVVSAATLGGLIVAGVGCA